MEANDDDSSSSGDNEETGAKGRLSPREGEEDDEESEAGLLEAITTEEVTAANRALVRLV